MHTLKLVNLFIKNNLLQLGRKWLSLPLLLLSPIILVSLLAWAIISMVDTTEQETMEVGLVNLDQSEETALIVDLLAESSQLGEGLHMEKISEAEGQTGIEANQLSSYMVFPADFFQGLLNGQRSQVTIVGNPEQPLESQLINELMETVTRHIRGSQANILTINDYAKRLDMDNEARNDMLFEQFVDFFFYVLGSNQVVDEQTLTNHATASPVTYFSLAGWFTLITIWLFILYTMLHRDNDEKMRTRMRLYGVTDWQQAVAAMIVSIIILAVLAVLTFAGLVYLFDDLDLTSENYGRIAILTLLHSSIFLQCLILLDWLLKSQKLTLLVHTAFTGMVLLFSGAIIPEIYFPAYLEKVFSYSFGYQSFHWIEQISLNGRFYAEYQPLVYMLVVSFVISLIVSLGKGRAYK
ncbi:ABC transporter permease [Gracilibacillus timonensis]|uniref:ABC transporter permease n=1 Tax=Gracilibacillus timonensis TaxID=1816696 RepID=UPI000825CCBA|nr:ABC transporter permease [Gracilibacillus timonensis]